MATIKDIYEFIDRAERSRKYPTSTAQGLKAAVKLFESELNDEEKASVDTIKQNLDQIYQSVFNKNKNFTAASLATYKSRIVKVINDYEKYGSDATKMSNWTPKVINRVKRATTSVTNRVSDEPGLPNPVQPENDGLSVTVPANMHKIELALRPDAKFIIIVPRDLREAEVATLKAILDSLAVHGGGDGSSRVQETPAE